jgi:putative flippase GtrA
MTNPSPEKIRRNLHFVRAAAVLWALLILTVSSLSETVYQKLSQFTAGIAASIINILFSTSASGSLSSTLVKLSSVGLMAAAYAILALIIFYTFRIILHKYKHSLLISFGLMVAFAAVDELHRFLIPGLAPQISRFLFNALGGLAALAAAAAFLWLLRRYPRVLNRETISYVIFGVLTTLVNMIVYGLCYNTLGLHNLISNAVAWVVAVLFAYAVNKLFVFRSRTQTAAQTLREFGLFIAARLFSFGVDELGMWLLVDIARVNGGLAKIAVNIIVLLMNYFFSKRIIFKGGSDSPDVVRPD